MVDGMQTDDDREQRRSIFSVRHLHDSGLDLLIGAAVLLLILVLVLRLFVDP